MGLVFERPGVSIRHISMFDSAFDMSTRLLRSTLNCAARDPQKQIHVVIVSESSLHRLVIGLVLVTLLLHHFYKKHFLFIQSPYRKKTPSLYNNKSEADDRR